MSTDPNPQVDASAVEQARRQINRLAEEVAHLSEADVAPPEFYGEFLQRVLAALAAPAGAIWLRTPKGNLQLQYQIRMGEVGLENVENGRAIHDELLRQAFMRGRPELVPPHSGLGESDNGAAPGNPTGYTVLMAPIAVDKEVAGLVEVWQDPNRSPDAQRGFLQFLARMASLASSYTRNHQLRQMSSQQQIWTQLEAFAKNVHSTLNPTEVAYHVANEGRRLIECDRVSIGVREGSKSVVRAISGADVVERRSNLVQCMRALFDAVLKWDEKLVYNGSKDDSLPPKVLQALDAFLEESNAKLVVVTPLRDAREKDSKRPARSALMMEAFEPNVPPEQLQARMEVVTKHAAPSLYNAWEYRKIPFRFIWYPLAKIQEGLGGKVKAIVALVTFAVIMLLAVLLFVPHPLKLDASGKLQPKEIGWIYSPLPAHVMAIKPENLKSGDRVSSNQPMILMYSSTLKENIEQLKTEIVVQKGLAEAYGAQLNSQKDPQKKAELQTNKIRAWETYLAKLRERETMQQKYGADLDRPGFFWLKPPITGVLLTADFRNNLINRLVQPNEPLLRFGDVAVRDRKLKNWEIPLKIPQKHIGKVMEAFDWEKTDVLDVDFIPQNRPSETYRGRLERKRIALEAKPDRVDSNEAEPVVMAWVRLNPKYDKDGNPDIPPHLQLRPHLLRDGVEVNTRIRCGNRPMGYSLFYGVWEFFYENVVFFLAP